MYILLSISKDGASGEAVKPEMDYDKHDCNDTPDCKICYEWNLRIKTYPRIPVDLTNSKLKVGERFYGQKQTLLSYGQGSAWYNDEEIDVKNFDFEVLDKAPRRLIPEQPGKGEEVPLPSDEKLKEAGMNMNEYLLRLNWDNALKERDEWKAQAKALSAIKKGLEKSLAECMKLAHPSQEAPEQGEVKYELGKGLQAKVDFYREQTEKIRTWLDENKIGNPCQGFFDAVLEHLQSLTTPSLARHEAERRYPILSDDKNEIAIVESDRVNFLAGFEYRDGMGGEKESAEVFFDIYFDKNDNVATLTKFAIIEFAELYHKRNFPAPSLPAEQGKWVRVEDGLPDSNTDYEVWVKNGLIPVVAHYNSKKYYKDNYDDENYMEEGWYLSFSYEQIGGESIDDVTHYRPLPASPQTKK